MMQKPSIPKGTRDFSPSEMVRREYIFDTIRTVFKKYGYSPIETPAMENLTTLLGKYGEEGDKLLFKILNSGDFLAKADRSLINDTNKFSPEISEKGLRYDLTVPFARFVVQNRNDITFPFKRYQIQPVWRADRPQKGRYREFYQCDADVIGSNSLINEVELIQIIDEVFTVLGINVTVKLNNRKILAGISEIIGQPERLTDITIAIDKIDKIGLENVKTELVQRGISQGSIEKLTPFIQMKGSPDELIKSLKPLLSSSEIGTLGVEEIEFLFNMSAQLSLPVKLDFDLTLARGLNYYTGAIIEVKADDVEIGSVCGGGRYDDLTGIFGLPDVSGVGISFGADRIYDVLANLNLYPKGVNTSTQIMILNLVKEENLFYLKVAQSLRECGINVELYPDPVKFNKQLNFVKRRQIPYALIIDEEEIKTGKFRLRNLKEDNVEKLTLDSIIKKFGT